MVRHVSGDGVCREKQVSSRAQLRERWTIWHSYKYTGDQIWRDGWKRLKPGLALGKEHKVLVPEAMA